MRFEKSNIGRRMMALVTLAGLMGFGLAGCDSFQVRRETPLEAPVYGLPPDGIVDPAILKDNYMVILESGTASGDMQRELRAMGVDVKEEYPGGGQIALWTIIPPNLLPDVQRKPGVAWIEADRLAQRTSAGVQTCSGWNLDMLDQQSPDQATITKEELTDQTYSYGWTGKDAKVLLIDTGIRDNLGIQVKTGPGAGQFWFPEQCQDDRDGHGTQVATVIGDKVLGVAKEATLIPFNIDATCYDTVAKKCKPGCTSACPVGHAVHDLYQTLKEIDTAMAMPGPSQIKGPLIIVYPYAIYAGPMGGINGLRAKMLQIINRGAVFVLSAGNGEFILPLKKKVTDACEFEPGNATLDLDPALANGIITVGALSEAGRADTFNTGLCVDVFAPGHGIPTQNPSGACGVEGKLAVEGTSFAAAHVGGVLAQFVEQGVPVADLKTYLLSATRTMEGMTDDGVSTNRIVHGPRSKVVLESGIADADTATDLVADCVGLSCDLCSGFGETNPCNTSPSNCSGKMHCNGEACQPCGRQGDVCCSGNTCNPNLQCSPDNVCSCGGQGEVCCDGTTCADGLACKNGTCVEGCVATCCDGEKVSAGDLSGDACIRDAGTLCWGDHGGPWEIRAPGMTTWKPKSMQCPSLVPSEAVCCDGTRIQLPLQFDENVAKEVAIAECNKGIPSKMRETYMADQLVGWLYPDVCGNCEVLCCDGTFIGGDYSWAGNSGEQECKLFGGLSCRDHGYGPQWIRYGLKYDPNQTPVYTPGTYIYSKAYGECPTLRPCLAMCANGKTIFVNDVIDEDACNLFADEACKKHGGLLDAEFQDGLFTCSARCDGGQLIQKKDLSSKDECITWGGQECNDRGFGFLRRVRYAYQLVYDYDESSPGNCGANGKYCCDTQDNVDLDELPDTCMNVGYKCVRFAPPPNAVRLAKCSACGGYNQPCCPGDVCGTLFTCNPNTNKCQTP